MHRVFAMIQAVSPLFPKAIPLGACRGAQGGNGTWMRWIRGDFYRLSPLVHQHRCLRSRMTGVSRCLCGRNMAMLIFDGAIRVLFALR